jgi:6-pyruvoyltetrahydropterin/6-carboxytetrahydropterin synthase
MDFSGLKKVKAFLSYWFDHTFLVAKDDPNMDSFVELDNKGLIQLRVMDNPSIEGTSIFVLKEIQNIINTLVKNRVVIVERVEVFENEKNSCIALSDIKIS